MPRRAGPFQTTDRCLGRGATATVWEAVDLRTDERVALKCYAADGGLDLDRLEREVAALQLLDLPGVVRWIDRGVDEDGAPWVAMERVEGRRFPGRAADWETLEPVLRSLLDTLARVHAVGIVHRDLKPSNVLVRSDGSVVVLDFGLARGAVLGPTLTESGEMIGTPLYLAPEQLLGERVDARADLYALGVMLFEALAGEPPQPDGDFVGLWRSRLTRDAPALQTLRPDLPGPVCALVDQLLDRSPANRPQTASEVLALLGEPQREAFPWLGGEAAIEVVVVRALAGRPCTIGGPAGSGRSRTLTRALDALRAQGRAVWQLAAASGPYRSCAGHVSADAAGSADEAEALVEQALAAFLAGGGVVAMDVPAEIDVWTRRVLARCEGAVLATGDAGDVMLGPLSEEALRALFWGPERVWRLPSDGARELYRRTGGLPARVVAEVQGWIREGLVRWGPATPDPLGLEEPPDGVRLHVDRMALDRLAAGLMPAHVALTARGRVEPELEEHLEWTAFTGPDATPATVAELVGRAPWQVELERKELVRRRFLEDGDLGVRVRVAVPGFALWASGARREAHGRVADSLALGARNRLEHLARAERWEGVLEEAQHLALRWAERGSNGLAVAVLVRAVRVLPDDHGSARLAELVALAARLAVSLRDRATLHTVRSLVSRAGVDALGALVDGALAVLEGKGTEARAILEEIEPFADVETELCRQAQRVAAARFQGVDEEEALVEALSQSVGDSPAARAKALTWKGLLRYRQGRFDEAAALHEEALALREDEAGRLSSMLNLAAARVGQLDADRAEELAEEARSVARRERHLGYLARAEIVLRTCAHQRGAATPDLELLRALPSDPTLVPTEVVIAVRGRSPAAIALVQLLRRRVPASSPLGRFSGALAAWLDGRPPDADVTLQGPFSRDLALLRARECGDRVPDSGPFVGILLRQAPHARTPDPGVPP